jgi:hypothetical protein
MVVADDSVHQILVALIGTAGLVLVTLIPIVYGSLRSLHRKADRTYHHINNIEVNESVDGNGNATLGQLVRDGFARNDQDHAALIRHANAHAELLHEHGRRLDDHDRRLKGCDE